MTMRKIRASRLKVIKKELLRCIVYKTDDCCIIPIKINELRYLLKIQFADENKILVWEAFEINQKDESENYNIINESKILYSLLNILVWQKVPLAKDWF